VQRAAGGGPLESIRVIELASYISGPYATQMLASLGAEVLKVEPPSGDPFRRFGKPTGGFGPIFANVNHDKRSIVLDLKRPEAVEEILTLVRDADVVLTNWRPDVADRLGLTDQALTEANPTLIRAYLTGFGASGPLADRPVYDSIIQARAAVAHTQSRTDAPLLSTTYAVDKVAATFACQAILAALVRRAKDGGGERIDMSMLDAAAYFNFPDAGANRTFVDHQPEGSRNSLAAGVRPVSAHDGWIVVAPVTGSQLRRSCEAMGQAELAGDLLAERDPVAMLERFFAAVVEWARTRPAADCLDAFDRHDVPAGPCLTLDQHLADPQVISNDTYVVEPWPGLGAVRTVQYPARFERAPLPRPSPAPPLGSNAKAGTP